MMSAARVRYSSADVEHQRLDAVFVPESAVDPLQFGDPPL
jgi:hypothetical protein